MANIRKQKIACGFLSYVPLHPGPHKRPRELRGKQTTEPEIEGNNSGQQGSPSDCGRMGYGTRWGKCRAYQGMTNGER